MKACSGKTIELDGAEATSPEILDHAPEIRSVLLKWFSMRARDLPWRNTSDPYRIWISEVILQQTRVDQGRPFYDRFIAAFPSVNALADASMDEVLKKWEGLGYYSRARNLHRAAQRVVDRHDSVVPAHYDDLIALPGIGPYTARAILSIAFNQPYGVVDGNVVRVFSRVMAFQSDVNKSSSRQLFQNLADALVDKGAPGAFNEAMMELGATVCTPRNPLCETCPLCLFCAGTRVDPEAFPITVKKDRVPHHDIAVGLLSDERGALFVQRRPEKGLLGGLWEFPGGKRESGESIEDACRRELKEELGIDVNVVEPLTTIPHAYSHFRITLHAFRCEIVHGTPHSSRNLPTAWVAADKLKDYAFPTANRKLIQFLAASEK